ncbi:MAG: methyltransferase domain-containing protein, partial [Planctomycetota bacterium]
HVWGALRPADVASDVPPGRWEQPIQTSGCASAKDLLETTNRRANGLTGSTRALAVHDGRLPKMLYARLDYWNSQAKAGGSLGHTAHVIEGFDHAGTRVACAMGLVPPMVDMQRCPLVQIKEPAQPWQVEHYEHQFFASGDAQEEQLRSLALQHRAAAIYERIVIGSLAVARTCAALGIPHVLEYNGSEIWVLRHWAKTPLHHEELFLAVETAALRAADMVVVVSEPLRQELLTRGVEDQRILVNPNAVDPQRFDPERLAEGGRAQRARHGFVAEDLVVGFIGTFGAWHGIPALARALPGLMAISPRLKLLLIGDGNLRSEMEGAVRAGGWQGRVVITGIVAQDEAPTHLAACDIFVSPHQTPPDDTRPFFGSPTKLFEYLAMGRATVASDLGQIGEVISPALRLADLELAEPASCQAVGVLTRPGDAVELVAAIRILANRPAIRERLGRNGRERILSHHTWDIHINRIVERLMQLSPLTDAPPNPVSAKSPTVEPSTQAQPLAVPDPATWDPQEAELKDGLLISKSTTYAYMLRSPELVATAEDTWRFAVEIVFEGEGAVTFGALDDKGAWLSNVNLSGRGLVKHSCAAKLTTGQAFRLVIANCRAKAGITRLKVTKVVVEPLPPKRSIGDEAMKDEARRQWNTDHCGGDRGGVAETGSLEWFLNVERDRYESYAPWMKKAIGFERYSGKKVLEIGAGLGTDHAQFAKAGAITTDFDLAEGHLNMAKKNFAARGLPGEFILGDAEKLDLPEATFDVVYSFGVIHHTPGTEEVVRRIHKVLKPGGEAIIMVYAKHSWNYWYKDWWKLYIRGGLRKTMTMADVLSANTEHSPNGARPLVKVYSARECRRLFKDFSTVRVEKYQLTAPEIPSWFLKILPLSAWGRLMGWNMLIRARK